MFMKRMGGLFKSWYGSAMVMGKQVLVNKHGYISETLSKKEARRVMNPI